MYSLVLQVLAVSFVLAFLLKTKLDIDAILYAFGNERNVAKLVRMYLSVCFGWYHVAFLLKMTAFIAIALGGLVAIIETR